MGLSALLGDGGAAYAAEVPPAGAQRVPIEFLHPSPQQPRRRFDDAELDVLAQSIRERGVLQPLLVRPSGGGAAGYEIVAGERRWRAAQRAGQHEVPVVVRELSDQETLELALIENLQRADLSPLDEAHAYRRLTNEFAHTQEALAEAIGKSRSHVANTLRLLTLPASVQELVEDGRLSAGHARALVGSPGDRSSGPNGGRAGLERARDRGTGAAWRRVGTKRQSRTDRAEDPNVTELSRRMSEQLGLEVRLRTKGKGGVLTIRYHDLDQLDGLIRRLQ